MHIFDIGRHFHNGTGVSGELAESGENWNYQKCRLFGFCADKTETWICAVGNCTIRLFSEDCFVNVFLESCRKWVTHPPIAPICLKTYFKYRFHCGFKNYRFDCTQHEFPCGELDAGCLQLAAWLANCGTGTAGKGLGRLWKTCDWIGFRNVDCWIWQRIFCCIVEDICDRTDAEKPFMGLIFWCGSYVRRFNRIL